MTIVCNGCGCIHEMPLESLEYDIDCAFCDSPIVEEFTMRELGLVSP